MNIFFAIFCLLLSALFSSLTLGLMGLDLTTLRHAIKQGNTDAEKVYAIRKNGMLLLTTLLLGNAAATSFFSVLVGDIIHGFWAGLIATSLVFIVGEILPQAAVSRAALRFGAITSPIVTLLMTICYPVCGPIAWALNKILGKEHGIRFSKVDLLTMLEDEQSIEHAEVDHDERRIARGSLLFSNKKVSDVLTPATVSYTLEEGNIITNKLLLDLKDMGYSRIPVHTGDLNQFVGILYLKDLIGINPPIAVEKIMDKTIHFVLPTDPLDKVLNDFIRTKMHLFVVLDEFGSFDGVITVEDVVEEIIGQEIMDEDDDTADLREAARRIKQRTKKL